MTIRILAPRPVVRPASGAATRAREPFWRADRTRELANLMCSQHFSGFHYRLDEPSSSTVKSTRSVRSRRVCPTTAYDTPNLNTVVELYSWPGRSTVDGKCGLLGESGKCCVSRQNPQRAP